MIPVEAIRIAALNSVANPDFEYQIRRIFRFYSQKFNVPITQVHDIPLEFVLRDYFESMYEEMDEAALEDIIAEALKTPEEREQERKVQEKAAAADDEFFRQAQEEAKVQAEPPKEPPKEAKPPELDPIFAPLLDLPEINMDFSEGNLKNILDSDALGTIPIKGK